MNETDDKWSAAFKALKESSAGGIKAAKDRGSLPSAGTGRSYFVTEEQAEVVDQAIQLLRLYHDDPKMPEGRCLELACAYFMSGFAAEVREEQG